VTGSPSHLDLALDLDSKAGLPLDFGEILVTLELNLELALDFDLDY